MLLPNGMIDWIRKSLLGDNDVVEMAWNFLTALFAIRSVSYTKRLLHARDLCPAVERVPATRVSLLRGGRDGRLDVHGISTGAGIRAERVARAT